MKSAAKKPKGAGHAVSVQKPVKKRARKLDAAARLRDRIASRTARVGIVGLGYVGLPLAMEFAKSGFEVTGIDVD